MEHENSRRLTEAVDALNAGDFSHALNLTTQLRAVSPTPQMVYVELMAMLGLGMLKQTEKLLRKQQGFLEKWPEGVGMSAHVQGRLAMRQGRPESAVPFFRMACEQLTKNQSCVMDMAEALFHTHQYQAAHDQYVRAAMMGPSSAVIFTNLASCAMRMQQFDQAFAYNYVGWTQAPSSTVANHLGRGFMLASDFKNAIKHFAQSIKLESPTMEMYQGLAESYLRLGFPRMARRYIKRALVLFPNLQPHQELLILQTLGHAFEKIGEVKEWIPHSMRLVEIDPTNISFLLNMGNARQMLGDYEGALEWADRAESVAPEHPDIIYFRGFIKLLQGDWKEGCRGYEWRWRAIPFKDKYGAVLKPLQSPMWDGQTDLNGKVVMALCEQGAGDLVQYAIFIKELVDRGAIVDLLAPPSMQELMSTMPWVRQVHDNYFKVPAHDYHVPLMTLPLYFGTTLETLPRFEKPLIKLPQDKKRPRFSEKFTVGLCWYGDPKHSYDAWRSMPTHYLYDLIKNMPNVQFVSLQMEPHARGLKKYLKAGWLLDGMKEAKSFTDTAAAIDACDLILTVDTSVAHVAAAMHKKVWLMVSAYMDWRWLGADEATRGQEEATQWYPTMRIFHQKKTHDWRELLQRVMGEMRPLAALPGGIIAAEDDSASPFKRMLGTNKKKPVSKPATTTRKKRAE